jgi:hypothetical protein
MITIEKYRISFYCVHTNILALEHAKDDKVKVLKKGEKKAIIRHVTVNECWL